MADNPKGSGEVRGISMADNIPDSVKEKLNRTLRDKAVLGEKSKLLERQMDDYRSREQMMHHLANELLERQRELNYMLHRASSVLHQLQETNTALSAEFTHIVKELPPAKDGDWEQTIERVNQLFKKTHELAGGVQDEIFRTAGEPEFKKKPSGKVGRKSAPIVSEPPKPELKPEPVMEVAEPEPEPVVEPQFIAEPEPEPVVELQFIAEPELEPVAEVIEPEMTAEPEPVEILDSQFVIEPEPEPVMELAEPQIAVEPEMVAEPEPEPETEDLDYEFDVEAEQAPQAFGEGVITVEEPVEAEESVQPANDFDKARDEQIEQLFRQIQPIELKPPPIGRGTQRRLFAKLFRKDKTPV